ncbi:lipid A biosynthesis (KDO)2-(lauroyl)-lipid IVA acyltransferase [Gleimia coleocanis DSM 15436]|uniref:Lipid A biosynthesis (KDO)2-(Lauroyl)-lipid IVA acyltransferase n=1 Tax=Gleimia coleocanis DSM 15436 TaxID=525245 RepID=C0W1Q8_9ACTO|nr:phosphatidylinositol mannoside acyltransferase [Gleimia coleocanis]EEH63424.1 lipid A biosynthesis (KDO)2-(lauroyl)-lipid IVA acyltransferase [Gleimia coleocanis DSM 15436]
MSVDKFILPAFRFLQLVPQSVSELVAALAGRRVGKRDNSSNRQLRANYQRFSADLGQEIIPEGVARYFQMFAQLPTLHKYSPQQLKVAVEVENLAELETAIADGPVVLALTHSGNWDLAGAWCAKFLAPVLTVAEQVKPPALFSYFQTTRAQLGIQILPAKKGVFKDLKSYVEQATLQRKPLLVPLLADRDITGRGVPVTLAGETALVAAGPAALAIQTGRPLFVGHLSQHVYTWRGIKRSGIKIHLRTVTVDTDIANTTQRWVVNLEPMLEKYLLDWHMMQPIFLADLDLERLERARLKEKLRREEE